MKRQLVIQLARMGDLIQSKRLVLSLKGEGEVHIALDTSLEALGRIIFPYAILHTVFSQGSAAPATVLSENAKTFAGLAELDFTSVYNLNRSPLSLSLTSMFDPAQVIGYRLEHGQATSSRWNKMAWRWTKERKTSPLNLADFWGFFHPDPIAPVEVNPVARAKNPPGKNTRQRLGFVLSGRAARRSMPPEYLSRYIEALFAAHKGPDILLLGDKSEQAAARKICKILKPALLQHVEDLSGKTSLTDLHEVTESLDLLFTPDTGLMHLAAHLGTPVMACFLSSAWVWETGPYGLGHEVLQAVPPCAPCLETTPCPHKTICLAPFADPYRPGLAKHADIARLSSAFDGLGATYLPIAGDSAVYESARNSKRSLLAEYLKVKTAAEYKIADAAEKMRGKILNSVTDELLAEQDWMLPDYF
jgi:ADP-heptose:LPS heptosyltransferase